MRRLIITCLFFLGASAMVLGQSDTTTQVDSTEGIIYPKKNREPIDWRPSALRFGVDVSGPTRLIWQPTLQQFEGSVDLQIHKYHLVLEGGGASIFYGRQEVSSSDNYRYSSFGTFFRGGIDVNLMPLNPDGSGIYFGARYARSFFRDVLFLFPRTVNGFEDVNGTTSLNEEVQSTWWEITAGVKGQIWKGIALGTSARYRFGYQTLTSVNHRPFAAPGAGRVDGIPWTINVHIYYRIPFKLKPLKKREEPE